MEEKFYLLNFKKLAQEKGVKMYKMACKTFIKARKLSKIKGLYHKVTRAQAEAIAEALGVTFEDLGPSLWKPGSAHPGEPLWVHSPTNKTRQDCFYLTKLSKILKRKRIRTAAFAEMIKIPLERAEALRQQRAKATLEEIEAIAAALQVKPEELGGVLEPSERTLPPKKDSVTYLLYRLNNLLTESQVSTRTLWEFVKHIPFKRLENIRYLIVAATLKESEAIADALGVEFEDLEPVKKSRRKKGDGDFFLDFLAMH